MKLLLPIKFTCLRLKCILLIFGLFSLANLSAVTISNGASTVSWTGNTVTATDNDIININELTTHLASGDVFINTTGNVTVSDAIATTSSIYTLNITATGDITVDAAINLTGAVGANANPGQDGKKGGSVSLTSTTGNVTVNQPITTTGGKGGNGNNGGQSGGTGGTAGTIAINANDITVNATLNAVGGGAGNANGDGNGGKGGLGGNVSLTASDNLVVSGASTNINTQGGDGTKGGKGLGNGGKGGDVTLMANHGTIDLNMNAISSTGGGSETITSSNQPGGPVAGSGGQAGKITITSENDMAIATIGGINAAGGNGGNSNTGNACGGPGGLGNDVTFTSNNGTVAITGGTVSASGGNGGLTTSGSQLAGNGSDGGKITIQAADADVQVTLNTAGGNAGAAGGSNNDGAEYGAKGGSGGNITIETVGELSISGTNTKIDTYGGYGTNALKGQGNGGNGGSINITSKQGIVEIGDINSINTTGGDGGKSRNDANPAGKGGNAGAVAVYSYNDLSIGTIINGINATGGKGGNNISGSTSGGGAGGNGGEVRLFSDEGEVTSKTKIDVSAGKAGDGQENMVRIPGAAGNVLVSAKNDITIEGAISANGGADGSSTQKSAANPYGGTDGGSITISSSSESVTIKAPITANGGVGAQRSNGYCGSKGGNGGSIVVEALKEINIQAKITANGEDAGLMPSNQQSANETDHKCFPGGNAGTVDLSSGTINVDAEVQANGGTGGASGGGGDNKAGQGGNGGTVNIEGVINTGSSGSINVDGGTGGSKNLNGNGKCSEGGAGGNVNVAGETPEQGDQGASGGVSGCNPATLCPPPVIQGLYDIIPPFCMETNTNLNVSLNAPAIEWNATTPDAMGFQIETEAGSASYANASSPFAYTVTSNADNGKRVRYYATNTCGQTTYAYAVINKSCPVFTAVLSGNATICDGTSTDLTITITNASTPPYSIIYTDGVTPVTVVVPDNNPYIFSVTPATGATYTLVSGTDANGKAGAVSGTATITIDYTCIPDAVLSGGGIICNGDDAYLHIDVTDGTAPYTVVYTDGKSNYPVTVPNNDTYLIQVNPSEKTTYALVSVTDSKGTDGTISGTATVQLCPNAVLSGGGTICDGSSTDLTITITKGIAPYTVIYSDGGGSDITIDNITTLPYILTVTPASDKTYTLVSVTDDEAVDGEVSGTATVTIDYNCVPDAVLSGGGLICRGDEAYILIDVAKGISPYTVVYNDGATDIPVTVPDNNTYSIKVEPSVKTTYTLISVTDSEGTVGNISGSATVELCPLAVLSGNASICEGNPTNLTITITKGTAPYTVVYSDGRIDNITTSPYILTVSPTTDQAYTLISVTDNDGIEGEVSGSATVTVYHSQEVTISEEDGKSQVSPGGEVTIVASGNTTPLTWNVNGQTVPEPAWPMQLFQDLTTYVTVDDGVCPAAQSNTVTIKVIWPSAIIQGGKNGANAEFLIGSGMQLYVFNRYGATIYKGTDGWDGKYNNKYVDPGTYYYVVELPNGEVRKATLEVVKE